MLSTDEPAYAELFNEIYKKLDLTSETKELAGEIFTKAISDPVFVNSKITLRSLGVSSVYLASGIMHDKITQYDLSYLFKVSPTTIRHVYKRLCEIMDIDRNSVIRMRKVRFDES